MKLQISFPFVYKEYMNAIGLCRTWGRVVLLRMIHWLLCHSSAPPALHACVSMDCSLSFWPRWSCTPWAISRSVSGFHEAVSTAQLCNQVPKIYPHWIWYYLPHVLICLLALIFLFTFFFFFWDGVLLCPPGWSVVARSWLTAASASWVQAILLSQSPK